MYDHVLWFGADLSRGALYGADLDRANLYDATFGQYSSEDCHRGARRREAVQERRQRDRRGMRMLLVADASSGSSTRPSYCRPWPPGSSITMAYRSEEANTRGRREKF